MIAVNGRAAELTERESIEQWRLDELTRAGYPVWAAEKLAARLDIDLHKATDMVENGCEPKMALEILL